MIIAAALGEDPCWEEERNVKTFYSAQDIETLVAQGVRELATDEDTVLTDLARERAAQLGLKLVAGGRPSPTAPRSGLADSAPAPRAAASSGAKPKGCQHGPLGGGPALSGAATSAPRSSNSPVVDELVGAVRQLAGKQGRG